MVGVHHDAGDGELLVDAADHDLLVDALVLAANEVAVEVDVEVVEGLAAGQRHVGVDVVHVEGVGGHRHATVAQDVGAVAQAVHEQVLGHVEVADLVPGDDLVALEHVLVVDDVLGVVLDVLVDVVGDHEVDAHVAPLEVAQGGKQLGEGVVVKPVVGVDDLEVEALGVLEGGQHRHAVAAVLLVHGLDDVGVAVLPLESLLVGVVLGGAVVDDDDLHVVGVVAALKDRGDAVVHVLGGVVARDAEGDGLACSHTRTLLVTSRQKAAR